MKWPKPIWSHSQFSYQSAYILQAFQTQWEVIVSYLYQLAVEYPWKVQEIKPENEMMNKVLILQKNPEKNCSNKMQKTELANFSDEESYETASEGEDLDAPTCPPLVLPSSINCDSEIKQSVESYYHHEGNNIYMHY